MHGAVRIGIVGDFDEQSYSHQATNAAIEHAAARLGIRVETKWLATPELESGDGEGKLARYDGLWASPGSPYKSFAGMLRAIEFARTRDWPFVGT